MRTTTEQRRVGGVTGRGFLPGRSGNPAGRPPILAEIRELARAQTEAAVETLVQIMHHGKTDAARVAAAVAILNRGWGKPAQCLEHTGEELRRVRVDLYSRLDDDELAALERILTKAVSTSP